MISLKTVYRERLVTQGGLCLAAVESKSVGNLDQLMGETLSGMTMEDGVVIPDGAKLSRVSLSRWGCFQVGREQEMDVRPVSELYY